MGRVRQSGSSAIEWVECYRAGRVLQSGPGATERAEDGEQSSTSADERRYISCLLVLMRAHVCIINKLTFSTEIRWPPVKM